MSSSELMEDLNLSTLPSDIIRSIIRMRQQSIESMRLISNHWNKMSIEHLGNRKHLPCIEYFRRTVDCNENKSSLIIPAGYRNYFGVGDWDGDETIFKSAAECVVTDMSKRVRTNYKRLFARCSYIGKLELNMNMVDCVEVIRIKYSLGNVSVDELVLPILWSLTLRYKNDSRSAVLDLLRTRSFRNLTLKKRTRSGTTGLDGNIAQGPFCGFVLEALTLVSSVQITALAHSSNMDHWNSVANALNEIAGIEAKLSFQNINANNIYVNATNYQICITPSQ